MQADSRPLLTIAIPTYRRSLFLREFLENLLPQLEGVEDVELLISDNASPDDTQEMLAGVLARYPQVRSVRQPANIGPDANFLYCYREAKGKYFWICGDDDILRPGTIENLLGYLRSTELDLVFMVPEAFYQDWRSEHQPDPYGRGGEIVTSARLMMLNLNTTMAFITAVVVNRDRVQQVASESPESLIGTSLIQLAWILPLFVHHRKSLVLWQRWVAARSMNSGFDVAEIFGRRLVEISNRFLKEKPRLSRMLTNYTLRQWFPPMLMDMRQHQANNDRYGLANTEKALRELFRFNPFYWLYVYPALMAPIRFRNLLQRGMMLANQVINFLSFPREGIHKLRLARCLKKN